jgi:hypothetical protein
MHTVHNDNDDSKVPQSCCSGYVECEKEAAVKVVYTADDDNEVSKEGTESARRCDARQRSYGTIPQVEWTVSGMVRDVS